MLGWARRANTEIFIGTSGLRMKLVYDKCCIKLTVVNISSGISLVQQIFRDIGSYSVYTLKEMHIKFRILSDKNICKYMQ